MAMTVPTAMRVLVIGGVLNLALSFLLGWVLSTRRLKGPMEPHRWLLIAHEVSLQEGCMLIALGFASSFARLPDGWATGAAWALVVASAFQDLSGVVNWLTRTGDQFAEKSKGWVLASINAVVNSAGLAVLTVGVVRGLW